MYFYGYRAIGAIRASSIVNKLNIRNDDGQHCTQCSHYIICIYYIILNCIVYIGIVTHVKYIS